MVKKEPKIVFWTFLLLYPSNDGFLTTADGPSETLWVKSVVKDGLVFFKARDNGIAGELQTGRGMWMSNGTPSGTKPAISNPAPGTHHIVYSWGKVGSNVYVSFNKDSSSCFMLYKIDAQLNSSQVMDIPWATYDSQGCMSSGSINIFKGSQDGYLFDNSKLYKINE